MQAPQSVRRPQNWQDFETLCKKLWGEIWNCPEIKKNGRNGQNQSGVDICGIPSGDKGYYGIQCKGKDEYTNIQFSESEISEEIEKAKKFKPQLKKFYLATTALKDVKIEEFVRRKNMESIETGFFEIHIFSWEDIVELIDENQQTHDWYLKNQNFKSRKGISVTFEDGKNDFYYKPKFEQNIIHFVTNTPKFNGLYEETKQTKEFWQKILAFNRQSHTLFNHSYIPIEIYIHNTGLDPIEDYKLVLSFEGGVDHLSDSNIESLSTFGMPNINLDVHIEEDSLIAEIAPRKGILVSEDTFRSGRFFIKPIHEATKIIINWKLVSKDYKNRGELMVYSEPMILRIRELCEVTDSSLIGTEEGEIKDHILGQESK